MYGHVYQYSVEDHGPEDRIDAPKSARKWFEDGYLDFAAEECAEELHNDSAGEQEWPAEMRLWKDGEMVGAFKVHIDYDPIFAAYEA